jgi:hypothetical protein
MRSKKTRLINRADDSLSLGAWPRDSILDKQKKSISFRAHSAFFTDGKSGLVGET